MKGLLSRRKENGKEDSPISLSEVSGRTFLICRTITAMRPIHRMLIIVITKELIAKRQASSDMLHE